MPLMMDEEMEVDNNDMDLDDLFSDGAGLSLPSRPPSKELHQRIDDLRGSGCCQTIAWSKWGSIASIASDGRTLELRNLRCHPENGVWGLSEVTKTNQLTQNMEGGPLTHLSWSPTGSDLAVIDAAGRVTVLSIFSSLNKPTISRQCEADPADDLHTVVGCHWLNLLPYPQARPTILQGPGIKEGSEFRYEATQAPVFGPWHPVHSKSAFVCVTANGLLRVVWPQSNNKWYELHTELESIVSSDDLITHAAICSDKTNTLLIAFATTSKQLRTVRALIDWGLPKADKAPQGPLPLNPSIRTRHLAVTSWLHDAACETINASNMESSMTELTQLEFLPPCGDSNGRVTPATIVATRSHLPVSTSHYNQDVFTTMDRWEVREQQQTLHPAFEHLSSRRNSVGGQPGQTGFLKKLDSFTVNKIAIAMQAMNLGKLLCLIYSDSSVEYRDRSTMAEAYTDNDLDRVWHLSQIGFKYTEDEPCLQVAMSPSYCSMAQIRNDGKVKWKALEYMGDIGFSMADAQYAATVAALALSCSTAVMMTVNYDDLLAISRKHSKANFGYDWLIELSKILKINVDYSEETHYDVLIRNTTIQLCQSIQNSLGFNGEFHPRSFPGKFAWVVLQLRNIVILVTMAANVNMKASGPNANDRTSPLDDPEVINSLAGSVRWVLDLLAWLTDSLLTLPSALPSNIDLTSPSTLSLPDLLEHLRATNTISLHLLLCSSTRGFLTAICRRLSHLDYIARKAIAHTNQPQSNSTPTGQDASKQSGSQYQQNQQQPQNPTNLSPALRSAYYQIATLTSATNIRAKTFETLLSSLTSLVKTAYASHQQPLSGSPSAEKARNQLEIKMLLGGQLPDAFKPVIVQLFKGISGEHPNITASGTTGGTGEDDLGLLAAVREEIEPAKLWFADSTMLEVDEDPISVQKRKSLGMTMDCFRKSWLVNPTGKAAGENEKQNGQGRTSPRWRRCARCAATMEDVLTQRPALQWLVMQQRRCYCSGYWDTLDGQAMI